MMPEEARAAIDQGAVILDLRPPKPFANGHLPGAINMQFNRADLADRAELVLPKTQPLIIHAEPSPIATTAVQILTEAGYPIRGHLEGGLAAWRKAGLPVEELPLLTVDELHDHAADYRILDVRERFEYRHGHIPGAELLPSGDAWQEAGRVRGDRPIAVVCGDQTRSAAVASMLLRADRDARLVMGGMVDWVERGFPVEKESVTA